MDTGGLDSGGTTHPILSFLDSGLSAGPFERSFVLAPSPVAAAALRRAITNHRDALLGVDFVTAVGLARQVLALMGRPHATEAPDPIEEREALRRLLPSSGLGAYAARFPGALQELCGVLREVHKSMFRDNAGLDQNAAEIADLAARWSATFAGRGGRQDWLATAAQAVADGGGPLPCRVLVVGPFDGENDVQVLLHVLAERGVVVERAAAADFTPQLTAHSQPTDFDELRAAARQCMTAAAAGMDWHEMVVAVPTLTTYRDHAERAFAREGVPLHTAAEAPLVRHPRAALLQHVVHLLAGDAPRAAYLALAGSPLLAQPVPNHEVAALDIFSRRDSLQGTGHETDEFVERLPSRDAPRVAALLRTVLRIRRSIADESFAAFVDAIERFDRDVLAPPTAKHDDDAVERLQRCRRAILFADRELGAAHFVTEWEELLRTRTLPLPGTVAHGVHLVTYRDALAIPCESLQVLGLSADLVPRGGPPTTLVGDTTRLALHLPTTDSTRADEEQQLRTLLRHAPAVTLHWTRADDRGRLRERTPWFHRVTAGFDVAEPIRASSHPGALAAAAADAGRCPTDLARLHLALSGCQEPAAYSTLLEADAHSLFERTQQLESFATDELSRDGDIGAELGAQVMESSRPVTSLWTLATCPHQFLFRSVLGLRPLPEVADPLALRGNEIGTMVHDVVEHVYRDFAPRLAEVEAPKDLAFEMLSAASRRLERAFAEATTPMRRQFPGLYALVQRRWTEGLHRAISADLAQMADDGSRVAAIEEEVRAELTLPGTDGAPAALRLHGKLDRRDQLKGGAYRILDFKTGSNPGAIVEEKNLLRGTHLQLILYAVLHQELEADVEQLESRAIRPADTAESARLRLENATRYLNGDKAPAILETLAVLTKLAHRGLLLPRPTRSCSWCDFRSACRRNHPPSAHRIDHCDEQTLRDFRGVTRKTVRAPRLSREGKA